MAELERAFAAAAEFRTSQRLPEIEGARKGVIVSFAGVGNFDLPLKTLDPVRGVELLNVHGSNDSSKSATVFIPDSQRKYVDSRLSAYLRDASARKKTPEHERFVESLSAIAKAELKHLWTDPPGTLPELHQSAYWEVWLVAGDGKEDERFRSFAAFEPEFIVNDKTVRFADRVVLIAKATGAQIFRASVALNSIAELRRATVLSRVPVTMLPLPLEKRVVDEMLARVEAPPPESPAVCVLDTGVNAGHRLLQPVLRPADCLTVDPTWRVDDHEGHGTEMAGLAAYGDLRKRLIVPAPVRLRHRLESVKILPPNAANHPNAWGLVTEQGALQAEINAPARRRVFSLSVGAEAVGRGRPSPWSAALDLLSYGGSVGVEVDPSENRDNRHRLFCVSAGNIELREVVLAHLETSDDRCMEDPGQAWNALTIGASTDYVTIDDPLHANYVAVALRGELSPYSRTSKPFESQWPLKPDIVFEGGNVAVDALGRSPTAHENLCVATTHWKPGVRELAPSWATSAATAQVAGIAGELAARYPDLRPETLRALVVNGARWTPPMMTHFTAASRKDARAALVRRYGFGVPNETVVFTSAGNHLVLIVEDQLVPFHREKMGEMRLHRLPWPRQALLDLGSANVTLRVTLSYFIEPRPGERGAGRRHLYASHGLRFAINRAQEDEAQFKKRVNLRARAENERPENDGDEGNWFLGPQQRDKGSLRHDLWEGTAADLATRSFVAVMPTAGWWKEMPRPKGSPDRVARYSLVMSVSTEAVGVDLWTPVATEIGVPTTVTV